MPPRYRDRIAHVGERWRFLCQRKPHRRLERWFNSATDARTFRSEHDAREHSILGLESRPNPATIAGVIESFLVRFGALVRRGARHPRTLEFYTDKLRHVLAWFDPDTPVAVLTPSDISAYIEFRMSQNTTLGAVIVDELKALRHAIKWKTGALPAWNVPIDDIQPVAREKVVYSDDEIVRFVANLSGVAKAVVALKLRVPLRNVELEELRVGQVDLKARLIHVTLHNKKKPYPATFPLTEDVAALLRPLVEGRPPSALVFLLRTGAKRVELRNLRRQFLEASRAAGLEHPISAIAHLRNHTISLTANDRGMGLAATSRAVGHLSEQTTAGYLLPDTSRQIELRRQWAEIIAAALPIR